MGTFMGTFLSVLGTLGGAAGIISIIEVHMNMRNNQYLAIHEYLKGFEDPEFIAARSAVYNHTGESQIDDEKMAMVVNYYHHWGILAKERYLPLRVFDEGSATSVIRLYEKSEDFIKSRRERGEDSTYASGFEWLCDALKKRKK